MVVLYCMILPDLSAQVTYDNNATEIGIVEDAEIIQTAFTVPAGDDRVLVAFVMRDNLETETDSITFEGQKLTLQINSYYFGIQSDVEIWSLTFGCGTATSDSIKAFFSGSPQVIMAVATFQNVDQFDVIGSTAQAIGWTFFDIPVLSLNTLDTNGMIVASVVTQSVSGPAVAITPASPGQIEIYEQAIADNSAQASIKSTTSGNDEVSWTFSDECFWTTVAIELLSSDQDGDSVLDCNDLCPMDSLKSDPGFCGCGVVDVDSDGDGVADCVDLCPFDSLKIDPGFCGCGIPDVDSDMDGIHDCNEVGNVLIIAGESINSKGPMMQGVQVTQGGDTTLLWSQGNRTGIDSSVTFMQHRKDNLYLGAGNLIGITLDEEGRVGIGMPPTSNALEVNGEASKSTPGNWLGNSDDRLKKNIQRLDPGETLSKLLQLQGVTYMWNDIVTGVKRPEGIQYGFLAQDIFKVFPELVVEDSYGYLQTSYGTFDPMILEGIRYINLEMDTIQEEVNKLLYRMDKLEKTLKTKPESSIGNND